MTETAIIGVWVILGLVVMAWAVASDARNRGVSPVLWGLLTLLFNVCGVLAYLVIRPTYRLDDEEPEAEAEDDLGGAASPIASAASRAGARWEAPLATAPRPERTPPTIDRESEQEFSPLGNADSPPNRTWIYVGVVVILGLVVAAALFALLTAPVDNTAEPVKRATVTIAPSTTSAAQVSRPTSTQPAALLAPTPIPTAPLAQPTPTVVAHPERVYVVKAGDTLSSIATRNEITVEQLQKANDLTSETIFEGQTLKIPEKSP